MLNLHKSLHQEIRIFARQYVGKHKRTRTQSVLLGTFNCGFIWLPSCERKLRFTDELDRCADASQTSHCLFHAQEDIDDMTERFQFELAMPRSMFNLVRHQIPLSAEENPPQHQVWPLPA